MVVVRPRELVTVAPRMPLRRLANRADWLTVKSGPINSQADRCRLSGTPVRFGSAK